MANQHLLKSMTLSTICAGSCLTALASASSFDGGPYWGHGSEAYYVMPLVETFVFFSTLIALVFFNARRVFAASVAWLCVFCVLLLGGGYLMRGHQGWTNELLHWTLLASIDLISAALFAAFIFVYPSVRRRIKQAHAPR